MPKPGASPGILDSAYGPRPPVPIPPIHTLAEELPPSLDTTDGGPENLPSPKKFNSLLQAVETQYLHELTFWTTTVQSLRSQLEEANSQLSHHGHVQLSCQESPDTQYQPFCESSLLPPSAESSQVLPANLVKGHSSISDVPGLTSEKPRVLMFKQSETMRTSSKSTLFPLVTPSRSVNKTMSRNRTLATLLTESDRKGSFLESDSMIYRILCRIRRVHRWCNESSPEELVATVLEPVMGVFILANCILTGVSLDTENWKGWIPVDWMFVGLFIAELGIRSKLLGWREVFLGSGWAWTLFDTAIIMMAIVDQVAHFSGSVLVLRALRLLRLARLVRLLRVPALKELVMLINGFVGCFRCLLWCICFLVLPIFVVGMILSQVLNDWDAGNHENGVGLFTSVPSAMFTTLRCMCGDCTDSHGRPIFFMIMRSHAYGWYFALFYAIFIMFTVLGAFNLINAIFVESTMQAAKSDPILQLQIRKAEDKKFTENIRKLIFSLWVEHSSKKQGRASKYRPTLHSREFQHFNVVDALDLEIDQEFYQQLVREPDIRQVLDDMGMHDDDIVDLFDMLDVDRSGTLDLSELVTGIHKLRGDARKSDLVALAYMIDGVQENIRELNTCVVQLSENRKKHSW